MFDVNVSLFCESFELYFSWEEADRTLFKSAFKTRVA